MYTIVLPLGDQPAAADNNQLLDTQLFDTSPSSIPRWLLVGLGLFGLW